MVRDDRLSLKIVNVRAQLRRNKCHYCNDALCYLKRISNVEQGISNRRSKEKNFEIRHSLFDILPFFLMKSLKLMKLSP